MDIFKALFQNMMWTSPHVHIRSGTHGKDKYLSLYPSGLPWENNMGSTEEGIQLSLGKIQLNKIAYPLIDSFFEISAHWDIAHRM